MLALGVCHKCAAFKGKKDSERSCHAMTPGCPVPQYMIDQAIKEKNKR